MGNTLENTQGRVENISMDAKEKLSTRLVRWLMAVALAVGIIFLPLDFFESYLYDVRTVIRSAPLTTGLIELVLIEPSSVEALKRVPTIADHTALLSKLKEEGPKAVVYVVNPAELVGTEEEKAAFVAVIDSLQNVYFVTNELAMKGEQGKLDLPEPFNKIHVMSGPITSDTKVLAQDGVTRRMMLSYQGTTMFHPYLAGQLFPERGSIKAVHGKFDFYDSEQSYIDMAPTGSFSRSNFIDVINSKVESGQFTNKVIFIGTELGESTHEYIRTSYSRDVTAMTVTEAHANMLNTMIHNSGVQKVPQWLNILLLVTLVLLTVEVVLSMTPVKGLMVLGLSVLLFAVATFVAFWPYGYWVNMAQPLLGIFVAYYFLIPYRLIVENRRSWELYHKNKLLTQVEELKSNFIGMMSHDLKTPLARISGMLEIVLRDKNPLSDDQKQALKSIQKSTDDLLGFISSILNFSRIESEGVQLNLKSKDINALIEEVLQKTDYLAKEKKIKIVKELEPLFSLRLDADLIRQVLLNLIENAIKYSPNDSKIKIRTEEKDNRVLIQVSDQGIGIPDDEMPRLFMKFFRSRKAKNSPVKGSGLGLYLSKYFVELHKGKISAISAENKGSTFTIELPVLT
ncbi:MAG: hypothetical protein RJB66_643 [Pseudomonadota bacterium]|jgi:signal transduction histidine kinase